MFKNNEIGVLACILDNSQALKMLQKPYFIRKGDRNLNSRYLRECKTAFCYENGTGFC